jgi:hypothetical protein
LIEDSISLFGFGDKNIVNTVVSLNHFLGFKDGTNVTLGNRKKHYFGLALQQL